MSEPTLRDAIDDVMALFAHDSDRDQLLIRVALRTAYDAKKIRFASQPVTDAEVEAAREAYAERNAGLWPVSYAMRAALEAARTARTSATICCTRSPNADNNARGKDE